MKYGCIHVLLSHSCELRYVNMQHKYIDVNHNMSTCNTQDLNIRLKVDKHSVLNLLNCKHSAFKS